ncbi:hypothetical protein PsorP6_017824 [Peronosclerospora sorghi]|uniref:Uncharacterized protein n=1 Tax=Peronosclerospora sorghi TaxID=230839 RepID=A0ACC0WF01_9STRA|nr:hypothetical protein PsorP6_017824 [Peronosclerospora sorghi]
MLPVKISVAISAISVLQANAARTGAYNLHNQKQLLAGAVTKTPCLGSLFPVEATNARVSTLNETPWTYDLEDTTRTDTPSKSTTALPPTTPCSSGSSLEGVSPQHEEKTSVYPTPAPTPCPFKTGSEIKTIQNEETAKMSIAPGQTTPCPPMSATEPEPSKREDTISVPPSTAMSETETSQHEKTMKKPLTPSPTTPYPPTSVLQTKPSQHDETAKA